MMLTLQRYQGDIDGFVEGSRKMSAAGSNPVHNITPAEVTINGHRAFSVSVGDIVNRFTKDGSEYELDSKCRFLSRVEKVASGSQPWKMLSMEVIYISDKILPVFPSSESKGLSIEGIGDFPRKSYQFLAYCLAEKGYQVKKDLPGVDDECLVAEVLSRNSSWLDS